MYHLYVDESFNDDQWWIAGIVVPEGHANRLANAISGELADAKRRYPVLADIAEWHGADMFHGRGSWRDLAPRERIGLYGKVLDAIATVPVSIICKGVDRAALRAKYVNPFHPHRTVMAFVLIDVAKKFCERADQCQARVFADQHDETYRTIGADLKKAQESGDAVWHAVDLGRIADEITWVDSRTSPIVQAADLVGFLNLRLRQPEKTPAVKRANRRLWRRIATKRSVYTYLWEPRP